MNPKRLLSLSLSFLVSAGSFEPAFAVLPKARVSSPVPTISAAPAIATMSRPLVTAAADIKNPNAENAGRALFFGERPVADVTAVAAPEIAAAEAALAPDSVIEPQETATTVPSPAQSRAERRLLASSVILGALSLAGIAGVGFFYRSIGASFWAGIGATAALGLLYHGLRLHPASAAAQEQALVDWAVRKGGRELTTGGGEFEDISRKAGIPMPKVFLLPDDPRFLASAKIAGRTPFLFVTPQLLRSPSREVVLAHEVQHLADMAKPWWPALGWAKYAAGAGAAIGLVRLPFLHAPHPVASAALSLAVAGAAFASDYAHSFIAEWRADLGAVRLTGDAEALHAARGRPATTWAWLKSLGVRRRDPSSLAGFPNAAPADNSPAYYEQKPAWVARLAHAPEAVPAKDRKAYEEEVRRLRPLARWMAHLYAKLWDKNVQRPPNLLTIQDVLNWASFVRKFERAEGGWTLKEAVVDGARAIFEKSLPAEEYEGRKLRREFETELSALSSTLDKLNVPEHLARPPAAAPAPEAGPAFEFVDETPRLFEAKDIGGVEGLDYVVTPTVLERLQDLIMLHSTDYRKKFFPLIIGPTGEGKSSLVKHMFSLPELKARLGRAVPVVAIPVKEAMTRRELLGGKGANGIELGFLSLAVQNGWVLVLEELNEASPEFLKSLNEVLHQIRKRGYFEFQAGGKTVRIQAHPHFWLVGTENEEEGNFALSRTPHSPDFMKRFVARYYGRIPPAEQAEIMLGLAKGWYGDAFMDKHGLTINFFERLVTRFHEPLRRLVAAGRLSGDLQEPYEFNRRHLHRFLRRYLADLHDYEANGKTLSDKVRYSLLARELMEAYASQVREPSEKKVIWDKMNVCFKLELRGVHLEDIAIEVKGFYRKNGKLVLEEKLVPIELPLRAAGGTRVPGPEARLTMVPSLAENVYRNLRNRQFHENQLSTGPTGTAKTSAIPFISHMLGEPLFEMTMDEQTPISEFHGGFLKDPATGHWVFLPGLPAQAMMYDPEDLLSKGRMSPAEARRSRRLGATLLINEGNANTVLETFNPAIDDGILNLSDGRHTAVAGGAFHLAVNTNPVGEGYPGFPFSGALNSRFHIVHHRTVSESQEEELTEILLDQLTGVTRHLIQEPIP